MLFIPFHPSSLAANFSNINRVNYVLAPCVPPLKIWNIYIREEERERGEGREEGCPQRGDETPRTSSASITLSFSVRFLSRFSLGIPGAREGENLSNSPWQRRGQSRGELFVSSVRLKVTRARYESRSRARISRGLCTG